jgi:hypothetical protein
MAERAKLAPASTSEGTGNAGTPEGASPRETTPSRRDAPGQSPFSSDVSVEFERCSVTTFRICHVQFSDQFGAQQPTNQLLAFVDWVAGGSGRSLGLRLPWLPVDARRRGAASSVPLASRERGAGATRGGRTFGCDGETSGRESDVRCRSARRLRRVRARVTEPDGSGGALAPHPSPERTRKLRGSARPETPFGEPTISVVTGCWRWNVRRRFQGGWLVVAVSRW